MNRNHLQHIFSNVCLSTFFIFTSLGAIAADASSQGDPVSTSPKRETLGPKIANQQSEADAEYEAAVANIRERKAKVREQEAKQNEAEMTRLEERARARAARPESEREVESAPPPRESRPKVSRIEAPRSVPTPPEKP